MNTLSDLRNLGPRSVHWLVQAGIQTPEDLKRLGAVEAYRQVKTLFPERVSLNLLYALQGALLDVPWYDLPAEMRAELREQAG